jgi:hypothetical protein
VHIDHLHGGELFQHAARRQPGRQRMQAPRKSDVQAIGQEGDEVNRTGFPGGSDP